MGNHNITENFNIWETNSPTYYINLNAKLHLVIEGLVEKIDLLNKHSAEFTSESAIRIKKSIKDTAQGIVGLSPQTDQLPDPSSTDIKKQEEKYKNDIFDNVFIPTLNLSKLVKSLNLVSSKSDNIDIDKIVKDIESDAKQILKLVVSPDLEIRARSKQFEKSRARLAKANGVEYVPNDPEDNHFPTFFAIGRGNPYNYEKGIYDAFKKVSDSFDSIKKLTYEIRQESRGIEFVSEEISDIVSHNNEFEHNFINIKSIIKSAKLGSFLEEKPSGNNTDKFSQSDKIRTADFIINNKFEDLYVNADDVISSLHNLEKFFADDKKYDHANKVNAVKKDFQQAVEGTRVIWATHSNIARNTILYAKQDRPSNVELNVQQR